MTELIPHFSKLADLSKETSSDGRRELLRQVTDAIARKGGGDGAEALTSLDDLLANVAADYSANVRAELSRLVAASPQLVRTAQCFALDEIAVAGPVLIHSRVVSDDTLLKVIARNSESHMLAVTQRQEISPAVSHALVQSGSDQVVVSLLSNAGARIGQETFETVAQRAQDSTALQAPLVRRQDVPVELLNELYTKVEASLRQEILEKFNAVSPDEIDKAFQRSRHRLSRRAGGQPDDYDTACRRIDDLARRGGLPPSALVTLLREGPSSRTAFIAAFARLADVEFDFALRAVTTRDLDSIALLCRGAGFDRALYVTLSIALKNPEDRSGPSPEELGRLYENVPVLAAQRAIRFWKVRAAA